MSKFTKKISCFYLIISFFSVSTFMSPIYAKSLIIASDEWCPYVCDDEVSPGFLIEIINEIAASNNIAVELSLMPLARALALTKKGEVDITLALTSQHILDFKLLQSSSSFGGLYNDFYVTKTQAWSFQGLAHLEGKLKNSAILGTINGYEYGEDISRLLKKYPEHVFSASGNSPLQNQLTMLQMGRLDILLDSRFTVQYQLSKMPNHNIIYAGTEGSFTPLFLGFSPTLDKKLISVFDQTLQALRNNGRLAHILMKYGIEDWQ